PIPCYVKVTNLNNGRSAIVRVNDRGPFHDDRVIDLSYAAAKKLGVYEMGTADVEVVAIDPADYQDNRVEAPRIASAPAQGAGGAYLQVGAFSTPNAAETYRRQALGQTRYPVEIRRGRASGKTLFKVLVGPFDDHGRLLAAQDALRRTGNLNSFLVYDCGPSPTGSRHIPAAHRRLAPRSSSPPTRAPKRAGTHGMLKTLTNTGLVITLALLATLSRAELLMPAPPQIAGTGWILMDANTGHVITEHNAREKLPPASL